MTKNQRSREAAYADLVSGLVDARVDLASERFDAELETAEASGRLDPATARLLRWWQRESVRAVTDHARATVPATLVALERAENEAREAVHRADAAWTTARGVSARATYAPEGAAPEAPAAAAPAPVAPVAPPEPAPPAPVAAAPVAPAPAPAPAQFVTPPPASAPPPPETASVTPTIGGAAPWSPTLEPPGYRTDEPTDAPTGAAPQPPYLPSPDETASVVDLTTRDDPGNPGATPAPGRRRTLLAGLTVLPRNE